MKKLFLLLLLINIINQSFAQDEDIFVSNAVLIDPEDDNEVFQVGALSRGILAPAVNLLKWAPYPDDQGNTQTCSAWSTTYCAATMAWAMSQGTTNRVSITQNAKSPSFTYYLIKPTNCTDCNGLTSVKTALYKLKNIGTVCVSSCNPKDCISQEKQNWRAEYQNNQIFDFKQLFAYSQKMDHYSIASKVPLVKQELHDAHPVVILMNCPKPFFAKTNNTVVNPTSGLFKCDMDYKTTYSGHAMTVVGYNDNYMPNKGAFLVQNSYGGNWGYYGYFWITYEDFTKWVLGAFSIVSKPRDLATRFDKTFTNIKWSKVLPKATSNVAINKQSGTSVKTASSRGIGIVDVNQTDVDYNLFYDDGDENSFAGYNKNNLNSQDLDFLNNPNTDDIYYYDEEAANDLYLTDDNTKYKTVNYENGYNVQNSDFNYSNAYSRLFEVTINDDEDTLQARGISGSIKILKNDKSLFKGTVNGKVIEIDCNKQENLPFKLVLKSDQPNYVYVISNDPTNDVNVLYPQSKFQSSFSQGSSVCLPNAKSNYGFTNNQSVDYMYILYSIYPLDYVLLAQKIAQSDAPLEQRIFDILGIKTLSLENSKVSGDSNFEFGSILVDDPSYREYNKSAVGIVLKFIH